MAKAVLYKDSNYQGQKVEVTKDIANFKDLDFNDKLTSVIVESGTFTLYSDSNYGSPSITISEKGGPSSDGKYPNSDFLGGKNDYFSSIRVNG